MFKIIVVSYEARPFSREDIASRIIVAFEEISLILFCLVKIN